MAVPHAKSGDLVYALPPANNSETLKSETLIRDDNVEIFRLVLEAGTRMQEHKAAGSMLVQCLQGEAQFRAQGQEQMLTPGSMIYLRDAEPHEVATEVPAVLLITLFLHRK
jgi:quercetin dioxygenase-like cupin family protein